MVNTMDKQTKIGFLFMIFLAVALFVSAEVSALELNSAIRVDYSPNDKGVKDMKVTITDTTFFGLIKTNEIGTLELKSHKNIYEKRGVEINTLTQEVNPAGIGLIYETNFNQEVFDGLTDVKIIDMRTGKELNRDWRFVYSSEGQWEIPIYKEVCPITKTIFKEDYEYEEWKQNNCEWVFDYYEYSPRKIWNVYDSKNIPSGKFELGIEIEVEKGDYLDIILKIGSKSLTKHAQVIEGIGNYIYIGGAGNQSIIKYDSDFNIVAVSPNYGGNIWSISIDDDYVYYGGLTTQTVRKAYKTNLSTIIDSPSYGGDIFSISIDDDYVYYGGTSTNKVRKAYKTNLSTITDSPSYGGEIHSISIDDDYVYYGGATTRTVRKAYKTNLLTITNSPSYNGDIHSISIDDDYVYYGGDTRTVRKAYKTNLTTITESPSYGGNINSISIDDDYVYYGGETTRKVRKAYKTNLSTITDSPDYGGAIWSISIDNDYVYYGGYATQTVRKAYKTNLTTITVSPNYGGAIYSISIDKINKLKINLFSPENNELFNQNEVNFNFEVTDKASLGIKNVSLVINDTIYQTNTSGLNGTYNFLVEDLEEGYYEWYIEAYDDTDEYYTSKTRTFSIDTTLPNITVTSGNGTQPYYYSGINHTVNFTIEDDNLDSGWYSYNGTNASLLLKDHINTSEISSFTTTSFVKIDEIKVGTKLNYTSGEIKSSSGSYQKELLQSIVYMNGTVVNQTKNTASTTYVLDIFTNPNPDELVDRVEYWAREVSTSGVGYVRNRKVSPLLGKREFSVTFPVTKDVYDFTIYANDTFGNLASKNVNWSYLIFEDAIGFNTKTFTTKQENFYLNFTTPTAIIPVVYLEYNGTEYLSTRIGTSTNHQISNTLIPNTIGDLPFRWKITWGTNTVYTPYYTQTVQSVAFLNLTSGNCAAGLTNVMNFIFKDESNQTDLTGVNIKYNFEYGITGGTGAYSYGSINAVTKLALCINTSEAPTYEIGYGEIEYAKEGYTTRRYYIFDGTRLTNVTTNTTLYSLPNGDSTSFLLEVRSPTLQPYVDVYTSLLRWYPDSNEYKIVEMGSTDNKGQTVFKVKIEDVDYRIGIYNKNGSLIYLINPVRMVCLASPCSYTINVPVTTRDYLKETLGLEALIEYEDGMFTLTYNDPSQNTELIRFVITQFTGVRDTVICETNGTSFTGILTCNVSGYEGTLKAVAYRTASPENPIALKIIQIGETVFQGTFGLFLQFLISIVLAFLGIINPVTAIILGLIAMVFGVMVIKTITYPILIAFSVLGGIIIYMMRRNT